MSFAACKTMHCPTGIENCASGFITHSAADITPQIQTADVDSDWPATKPIGPVPNLVVSAGNVLDVYLIRVEQASSRDAAEVVKRGGLMAGISAASLELVCTYRLHGNIYSMGVITAGGADGGKRRDSIILSFEDAKMSVLEFDDATHGLRTSSMHFFEGPDWFHLKRGRESFDKGPIIKVDPQGRCAGVFAFEQQMIVLKAAEVNSSLAGEDSAFSAGGASARIESSYIITLRDLDVRHVKDFTFLHGYIEPVMVILHERELTWSGRVSWKHHTCMVSAFSISTTLKQHPLIWSATNLPHDAYKLLAVPSPIGGVLVIGANTIHYHSQSSSCSLALNNFAFFGDNSQEMPRSSINVELDAANATWLTSDVAMLSLLWMVFFRNLGQGSFLLIQVIILLDATHSWNDSWVAKDEQKWYVALLVVSVACYIATFVFSGILFMWFNPSGHDCGLNVFFIVMTMILAFAFAVIALHPKVNGSLLPASVISVYCAYVCYSGLSSEPRDYVCNGLHNKSKAVTTSTLVLGMLTTVLSVLYSALRAGSATTFMSPPSSPRSVVGEKKSLLASEELESGKGSPEARPVSYSYTFFHLIFALASMYSAMLLSGWTSSSESSELIDVGWTSLWVRICTEWVTAGLYVWSLVAPLLLPDREFY